MNIAPKKAYVIKRDGTKEELDFQKITQRLEGVAATYGDSDVDYQIVVQRVIAYIQSGMTTSEIDNIAASRAIELGTVNLRYAELGNHLYVSNMHKNTPKSFSKATKILAKTGLLMPDYVSFVLENSFRLNAAIVHENDFHYTYVGCKTLERGYLLKAGGVVVERPQYMLMRIAVWLGKRDLDVTLRIYTAMSQRKYTHATPTCFNAGLARGANLSSCFLLRMQSDSIHGIFNTFSQMGAISKAAGGIGVNISNIRARGAPILGTQGVSNGIAPMLSVMNAVAQYVDQGGGKRKGSAAIYLEPWHRDFPEFLTLRRHDGLSEMRTHDLFPAVWASDIFMKRVFTPGAMWTMFCPKDAPLLLTTWGEEHERLYLEYEKVIPKERTKVVPAESLLRACAEVAFDSGLPYFMFSDAANRTSNQRVLGDKIRGSNLCTEIIQYSSPDEIACCNLASIALQRFCTLEHGFDFIALGETVRTAIEALDRTIDISMYPSECENEYDESPSTNIASFDVLHRESESVDGESSNGEVEVGKNTFSVEQPKIFKARNTPESKAERSNKRHRPLGLGVQGLADVFFILKIAFDSPEARELNKRIFACIYWHAVNMSVDLAERFGAYETFRGSPAAEGKFQFDLWNEPAPEGWDWEGLRERMVRIGLRNSLLTTVMPTATTAIFLNSTEMVEPIQSNLVVRQSLAGDFTMVNNYLIKELEEHSLWTAEMREMIIRHDGSVQAIEAIPVDIRNRYKTVWEISQKVILQYARDRAPYICQSQSTNIYLEKATYAKYAGVVKMAWELGLITGIYYLKTKSKSKSIQFTMENSVKTKRARVEGTCDVQNPEDCMSCSS